MHCYSCGKRVNDSNSYHINKTYRICRSCMQNGRLKITMEIIEHNENVKS